MLRCNQRIKFSGKKKIWEEMEDGEKGGKRRGKREKGEGLFLWRGDEKVKGLGLS